MQLVNLDAEAETETEMFSHSTKIETLGKCVLTPSRAKMSRPRLHPCFVCLSFPSF